MTEGRAAPLTREQWLAECCKLAKVYEDNMTKALDEIEKKKLIARLRARTDGRTMLACDPPRPAPDRDCHAAADLIEQHEAYRQEVNDELLAWFGEYEIKVPEEFARFIIAKPDPLVDALGELADRNLEARQAADTLRAAIEKRGGKIVWGEG